MKKNHFLSKSCLTAGILTAAMSMNVLAAQITEETAKSIALEHAGQSAETTVSVWAHSDIENGRQIYDINFITSDYKIYKYEIGVEDGMILSIDYESGIPTKTARTSNETAISLETAKVTALQHAGFKAEDVTFVEEKTDYDDGWLVYEIKFRTGDYKEYDYEINGITGAIVSWDYDIWDYLAMRDAQVANSTSRPSTNTQSSSISDIESAKAAALRQAGLNASDVIWGKVEIDYDDGRFIYEGKFFSGTMEYEFEIDKATGAILDWDIESIYD